MPMACGKKLFSLHCNFTQTLKAVGQQAKQFNILFQEEQTCVYDNCAHHLHLAHEMKGCNSLGKLF